MKKFLIMFVLMFAIFVLVFSVRADIGRTLELEKELAPGEPILIGQAYDIWENAKK